MLKFFFILVLSLSLNLTFAAGSAKMIDYMISESGVIEILAKYGIKGNDAKQVESYMNSALVALTSKSGAITRNDLTDVLSKLPVTGQDATIINEPEDKIYRPVKL